MRGRPILFSGAMVRAILDGRKSQTRRCVNTKVPFNYLGGEGDEDDPRAWGWEDPESPGYYCVLSRAPEKGDEPIPCPYGVPGDRLWVKETFAKILTEDCGGCVEDADAPDPCTHTKVEYRADGAEPYWEPENWTPSIFMPRWASRLTLEVTGVRVERVQAISEADAWAEGVEARGMTRWESEGRDRYAELWDSINKRRPGCTWTDNPWVWAITFRRLP